MPSFRISPWIAGHPQRELAVAMRVTRALISALTGGRFPVDPAESSVQQIGSSGSDWPGSGPGGVTKLRLSRRSLVETESAMNYLPGGRGFGESGIFATR